MFGSICEVCRKTSRVFSAKPTSAIRRMCSSRKTAKKAGERVFVTKPSESLCVWVLTDGKIGDDVQCLAVAGALAPEFEKRVIAPAALWSWLAPWGPIDPRDNPALEKSPIHGAAPDLVIASGRRAIPYARAVKRASGARTKIVILKDPRFGRSAADFIWAPAHDHLSGPNVFSTLTSPHPISGKLETKRSAPAGSIGSLPKPILGVALGGPSGGAHYGAGEAEALGIQITSAARQYKSVAMTPSRRTPEEFMRRLSAHIDHPTVFVWDGRGENPYVDILATAHTLIVAADSHNMMSEAAASGVGVYAYRPPGLARKLAWFIGQLEEKGAVRPFVGEAVPFETQPIDATPSIAAEIENRLRLRVS